MCSPLNTVDSYRIIELEPIVFIGNTNTSILLYTYTCYVVLKIQLNFTWFMGTGIMSSEKTQNRRVMSAETVVQNMRMTSRIRISTFMITLHVRLLLLAGGTVGTY